MFETLINPFRLPPRPAPPNRFWAYLRWSLNDARLPLAMLAIATTTFALLDVWSSWFLGRLVDMAAASGPEAFLRENFWTLIGALILFCGIRPVAFLAQGLLNGLVIGPNVSTAAFWRLHRHTLGQSMTFFQDDFAGRLAAKQIQTGWSITAIAIDAIGAVGMLAVYAVGMAVALAAMDWRIALAAVVWMIIYVFAVRSALPRIRQAAKERAEARSAAHGRFVDSFTNITTVKLFAHAEREEDFAREGLAQYRDKALGFGRAALAMRVRLALLNSFGVAAVMAVAVWQWQVGAISVGALSACGAMMLRATAMSGWVAWTALDIFSNIGVVEDGLKTLAPEHDIQDSPKARPPGAVQGRIAFEDVSFAYGKRAGGVRDLTLTIEPGEKVGLVGRSGAGKSTLVNLLLRLYDVEQGRVALDGVDVRDLTQDGLRAKIAMVTQETAMFNRSALDNILYGRPDAGRDAALEAAKQAKAHDFIQDLRDRQERAGYDAHLGERGVKLSGGQRQRVAIARAILKDAPILVLDEATSALDSEVEAEIQAQLYALMAGKTVIAIAHRLSTVARMDRIVVLDDGAIVEQGGHDDLLARGGLYAGFWNRQSGGFLGIAPVKRDGTAA